MVWSVETPHGMFVYRGHLSRGYFFYPKIQTYEKGIFHCPKRNRNRGKNRA